jgi:hypothetical protein
MYAYESVKKQRTHMPLTATYIWTANVSDGAQSLSDYELIRVPHVLLKGVGDQHENFRILV